MASKAHKSVGPLQAERPRVSAVPCRKYIDVLVAARCARRNLEGRGPVQGDEMFPAIVSGATCLSPASRYFRMKSVVDIGTNGAISRAIFVKTSRTSAKTGGRLRDLPEESEHFPRFSYSGSGLLSYPAR